MCAKNESNHKRSFFFYTRLAPFRLFLLLFKNVLSRNCPISTPGPRAARIGFFLFKSSLAIILAPATIGATGIVPPRCLFLRLRAMIFSKYKK